MSPLPKLSACPSKSDAREPKSVAILLNLRSNNGAMMQKANVSHGKIKWTGGEKESYPAFVV
jgi:hypothetical protein